MENEIALACQQVKIKDIPHVELRKNMLILIGKTHLNCGFKLDETQVGLTVDELCSDLQKYNKHLSFNEIQIAFNNGYKKQYGEYYGLNNATYFQWVNGYTWSDSRLKAKKALLEMNKPKPKDEPTEEQQDEILKKASIERFEKYKESKNLQACSHIYGYLEKIGLLVLPVDRKKEYMEMAKKELAHEQSNEKAANPFNKAIEATTGDRIKSRAKLIAVRNYFDSLIELGTTLLDELNE